MGHLLRIREIIASLSEEPAPEISPTRRQQFAILLSTAEEFAKIFKTVEEKRPGVVGVLARAIHSNIMDWTSKVKQTRFVEHGQSVSM